MFHNLDVFKTAMALARHSGHAQALSAQNIANADTPGYQARVLPTFQETLSQSFRDKRYSRSGHLNDVGPKPSDAGTRRIDHDPNGNSVSLELEMIKAVDAKRSHDRALAIYRNSLSILRTSLGRS